MNKSISWRLLRGNPMCNELFYKATGTMWCHRLAVQNMWGTKQPAVLAPLHRRALIHLHYWIRVSNFGVLMSEGVWGKYIFNFLFGCLGALEEFATHDCSRFCFVSKKTLMLPLLSNWHEKNEQQHSAWNIHTGHCCARGLQDAVSSETNWLQTLAGRDGGVR